MFNMEFNEKWTRDKFLEYRRLKRNGYSNKMLIEYFGDDIYYSGMYNRTSNIIPYEFFTKYFENKVNEIKINPEETNYDITPTPSNLNLSKMDYILTFVCSGISYTICLMYYKINNIDTYNIVFTTTEQWNEYRQEFFNISKKGNVDDTDWQLLNDIISRETNFNDLFPIFKKLSWILLNFYENYINGFILSIGDTENKKKISLYRNIIKDSFININEEETTFNGNEYYLYSIKLINNRLKNLVD
jgi:hypothetical protein